MLKTIFTAAISLALVAVTATDAGAQVSVHFGAKGGAIFSKISSDNIDGKNKTGLISGGFVEIRRGAFSLQPEILYVARGYKLKTAALSKVGDIEKVDINYIELPVLIKYAFPATPPVRPHLFAGPAVAVEIGATSYTYNSNTDVGSQVNNVGLNAIIGAGVDLAVGNGNLTFDIRYMHGITETFDPDKALVEDGGNNSGFAIMAGFSL